MSRIFISHSSKDNAQSVAISDWLLENGWGRDDIFLDIDPHSGIAPGERWQRALNDAANRCEAVLFLISRSWLASRWCLEELSLAHKLNKRMFGVLIDAVDLADVPARLRDEWQLIDLEGARDGRRFDVELPNGQQGYATFSASGLDRLRGGLLKAGIDPRFFAWPPTADPDRAPYRGLAAMEAEDAGIFYGREASIIAALDQVRGLAETSAPQIMVILGASGAGKSSFLRAGLIPRLRRDDHNFLVLPIVRPERAALSGGTGFIASLEGAARAHGHKWTRASLQKALDDGGDGIADRLAELVVAASGGGPAPRTVILPLDQAEELFMAEGRAEAEAFLTQLARLLGRGSPRLLAVATVRTDSYEELQSSAGLADVRQAPFNLPALARGSYQRVIEGPAERLEGTARALKIEPSLTAALLADIEEGGAKDALPLLAFTLARLLEDHGGDGDLTLAEYEASGRIAGSIEAAVERALAASDADPAVPRDRSAKVALLRRAMIPWLAGIDPETRSARRKVALFADIPAEARPLVEHFIAQRLLSTDVSPSGERTVEPAHEALLRQWGLIDAWLKEDVAILATLEAVQRAARDWDANARDGRWLAHAGGRLEDAEAVKQRTDLARSLDARDLAYLDACRAAETARHEREEEEARKLLAARELAEIRERSARRSKQALVAVALMALLAVAAGVYGLRNASIADEQRMLAEASRAEAEEQRHIADAAAERALHNETVGINASSRAALAQGHPVEALKLALAAWPRKTDARPALGRTVETMAAAIEAVKEQRRFVGPAAATDLVTLPERGWVAASHDDGAVLVWDVVSGDVVAEYKAPGSVTRLVALGDGGRLVAVSGNSAMMLDPPKSEPIAALDGHTEEIVSIAASPDGRYAATGGADQMIRVWSADGSLLKTLDRHRGAVSALDFSEDSKLLASGGGDGVVQLWRVPDLEPGASFVGHGGSINSVRFSADGARLLTTSNDKTARVWNVGDGAEQLKVPEFTQGAPDLVDGEFAPDGGSFLVVTRSRGSAPSDTTRAALPLIQPRGVAVYDRSGTLLHRVPDDAGRITVARYMPTGNRVAIGTATGTVRLVDATSGEVASSFSGHGGAIVSLGSSMFDAALVSASEDGTVRSWIEDYLPIRRTFGREGNTWSISFSPDGVRVAAAGQYALEVFDAANGERLWSAADEEWFWTAFSPDGRSLVATARSGLIQLFDPVSGARRDDAKLDSAATYVSFSPDGRQLAVSDERGFVRLFDAESLSEVDPAHFVGRGAISAEFSPDGKTLVAATYFGKVTLLGTGPLGHRRDIAERDAFLYRATFSPDGRRIVAVFDDGTLWVWNAEGDTIYERSIGTKAGSTGVPVAVFSPNGRRIAAGWGNDLGLWDAASGHQIGSATACFGSKLEAVQYPPSSTSLAVGCLDSLEIRGSAAFASGDLAELACARLGDNTHLEKTLADYGLSRLEPICGDNPPAPVDGTTR